MTPMRFGSDDAGFTVEAGALGVRVRAWGFWDDELAAQFAPAVIDALRAGGTRAHVLIDAAQLKPQKDAGQHAWRVFADATVSLGVARVELIIANAITKMQLSRIIRDAGARGWSIMAPGSSAPATGG